VNVATSNSLLDAFDRRDFEALRHLVNSALEAAPPKCILHPLGFYHMTLASVAARRVRIHYWPIGARNQGTAATPYHDHVWSLCSCVLAGTLENVLLDVQDDEAGRFQIARINQTGNVDEVLPLASRVQPHVQSRQAYSAGDFYEIEPGVFHFTDVPPDRAALTVVRAETVIAGGPRTLVPVGFPGHAPSRDPVVDAADILRQIRCLLPPNQG